METLIKGSVGPFRGSDGVDTPLRLGRDSELIVTELHGKYYEQSLRGNLFHATIDTAGVALAVAGTTAGIALANPAGSGKLLSLVRIALALIFGTYVVGAIMHGVNSNPVAAPVTGTAITPIPGLIGSNFQPVGKPFKTATLPVAQTALRPFALKNATPPFSIITEDVDGQIILSQGATWSLFVVGADTTPLEIASVTWEEIAA